MADLKSRGILAVFHYIPLDTALAGRACSPTSLPLPVTADLSARLLRLPLYIGLIETGEILSCVQQNLTPSY